MAIMLALPRRVKTALISIAAAAVVYTVVELLRSSSSPSHGPHPYSFPGNLTYDKLNPFTVQYSPQGGNPSRAPRLMERLMERTRGGEEAVQQALASARSVRPPDQTDDEQDDFDWLRGRTILLLGDSLDRYHAVHMCQFLTPSSPLVPLAWPYEGTPDGVRTFVDIHPLSSPAYPPALRDLEIELAAKYRDGHPFATDTYRPWVCHIKEFDAAIVWVFIGGLDDGETTPGVQEYGREQTEVVEGGLVGKEGTWGDRAKRLPWGDRAYWSVDSEHFAPPLRPEDRLRELVLPFLASIGRPSVDLVELGIGAWDEMMFKTQDKMSVANHPATLAPDSSPAPDLSALSAAVAARPLSAPRLAWYKTRLDAFLTDLVGLFPPTSLARLPSSFSPRVSVRTQVVPPQHYSWPWLTTENRVKQLETETKRAVSQVNSRIAREEGPDRTDNGREQGRRAAVRFNPWAEMVGSAKGGGEWLDHVHPGPIPGSYLWSDMMLYELRKHATGRI